MAEAGESGGLIAGRKQAKGLRFQLPGVIRVGVLLHSAMSTNPKKAFKCFYRKKNDRCVKRRI